MAPTQRVVLDYNKLCFLLLIGAVLYNELIAYFSAYSRWPDLKWPTDSLRILFVADPQLQGVMYESPFPVGPITRWDSDRYLGKTYSWAVSAYSPQVVVFLGDLIDEGSEGDEEMFISYSERFNSIYGNQGKVVKTKVFVPGDNDIGGEGGDPITEEKVRRFKDHFPPKPKYIFRGNSGVDISTAEESLRNSNAGATTVEIIPVSLLTQKNSAEWEAAGPPTKNTFRLVVSHLPVMPTQNSQFTVNVLKYLQPSAIFSAHDHRGMDYVGTRKTGRSTGNITFFSQNKPDSEPDFLVLKNNPSLEAEEIKIESPREEAELLNSVDDDEENVVHEIVVPTCSYRMGVREMAFGIGVIQMKSKDPPEMYYTNLWLPNRFALLYIYVATLLCCFALFGMGRCQGAKRGRRNSRSGRRSSSSSPSPNSKYTKLV